MCKCGCGTCETKITGPLLTESKVKSLLSEGLNHHISNAIPLHETVYRYGSEKHLALIKEARKLYSRHVIDLNEHDVELIKTHLGEWGTFNGEAVPLDLPMMNEEYSTLDLYQIADKLKDQGFSVKIKPSRFDKGIYDVTHFAGDIDDLQLALNDIFGRDNYRISFDENKNWKQVGDTVYVKNVFGDEPKEKPKYDPKKGLTDLQKFIFKYESDISDEDSAKERLGDIQQLNSPDDVYDYYAYDRGWEGEMDDDLENIYKQVKKKFPNLNEAKKKKSQKKDPPIGKPKRGGSKAYYVYVRDPKTKKIKKVSFGSGGLRAKINNPKARKAFAARHKCSQKNDRTKASYWSCRLPRYAKALGLGNNKNTFW